MWFKSYDFEDFFFCNCKIIVWDLFLIEEIYEKKIDHILFRNFHHKNYYCDNNNIFMYETLNHWTCSKSFFFDLLIKPKKSNEIFFNYTMRSSPWFFKEWRKNKNESGWWTSSGSFMILHRNFFFILSFYSAHTMLENSQLEFILKNVGNDNRIS